MTTNETSSVDEAGIFEFLYAGNPAEPGPRGECSVDGCDLDAWVRTRTSDWLCVSHYQEQFSVAVRAEALSERDEAIALLRRLEQTVLPLECDPVDHFLTGPFCERHGVSLPCPFADARAFLARFPEGGEG